VDWTLVPIFLAIGGAVGFIAGLLGIGGAVTMIPLLYGVGAFFLWKAFAG